MCIKEKLRSWWRGLFWHPIEETLAYHTQLNNEQLIEEIEKKILNIIFKELEEREKKFQSSMFKRKDIKMFVDDWAADTLAPQIQEWIIEEYSQRLQYWITDELLPNVEDWINKHYTKKKSADNQTLESYIKEQLNTERDTEETIMIK